MKLLIFAAIVLWFVLAFPAGAAENPGVICGKDISEYKVLDQHRFFGKNENLLMERTALGHPGKVFCLIHSIFKDGNPESVVKFADSPDMVTNVRTCALQPSSEYEAANEVLAAEIVYSTVLPYKPN